MSDIIKFDFQGHQVRVHKTEDGRELWVAKDVCDVLEIENATMAISRLDADEIDRLNIVDSIGRTRKTPAVTEPGLWKLVLTSRSEKAREVTRWFTHEVLPQIRQTGYWVQTGDEERVRNDLDRILRDRAMSWEQLWSNELPKVLTKICPNWKRSGHYNVPPNVQLDIYYRTIGKRAIQEARRRRDTQGAQTLHQFFQDDIRAKFRDKIEAVIAIANISRDYDDFQAKLMAGIGGAMLQIPLLPDSTPGRCPKCCAELAPEAAFCHRCGSQVCDA